MRASLLLFCLLFSCNHAPAPTPVPPPAPIRQIHIITPTAWWLRIEKDGSATYGHGSDPGPTLSVPPATFDITELAKSLNLRLLDSGNMADHYAVILAHDGETTFKTRFTKDITLISPLFSNARSRRTLTDPAAAKALDDLWSKTPPIEEPSPSPGPDVLFKGQP